MKWLRKIGRKALLGLDRPGLRWIPAMVYSVAGRFSREGVESLKFDDGWVHQFNGTYLVEARPRWRAAELADDFVHHYSGYLYSPQPGDVVIDVGAGYGWETLYFARKVGSTGAVLSIEAHPVLARMMERTCRLNGLSQVTVMHLALAEDTGTLFLDDDLAAHVGNAVSTQSDGGKIEVQTRSLDDICAELQIGSVDFLKMNIEGAEQLAIRGMSDVIKRTRVVAISCHDFKFERTGNPFFKTREIIEAWLAANGFVIVPRESAMPWLSDQVNAYNPALLAREKLNADAA
jgi:FkbM family methyltransferase